MSASCRKCLYGISFLVATVSCCAYVRSENVVAAPRNPITIRDAALLAQRIYDPTAAPLPEHFQLLRVVESDEVGLYAELYDATGKADATAGKHVVIAIRGIEAGNALAKPAAFAADVRAAARGGLPQWRRLDTPVLDELQKARVEHITCIGHSLGGMVAQLAAARLQPLTPRSPVTAILFNSPGVSALIQARGNADEALPVASPRLIHVVHHDDAVPRVQLFGGHGGTTCWYAIRSATSDPHSMRNFTSYLEHHRGTLPTPMSPEELSVYLAPEPPGQETAHAGPSLLGGVFPRADNRRRPNR